MSQQSHQPNLSGHQGLARPTPNVALPNQQVDGSSDKSDSTVKDEQASPPTQTTVQTVNQGVNTLMSTQNFPTITRTEAIRAHKIAERKRDNVMADCQHKMDHLRHLKLPITTYNRYSSLKHLDDDARRTLIEEAEIEAKKARAAVRPALRELEQAKDTLKQAEAFDCAQTEYLQVEYILIHEFTICRQVFTDLHPMDFLYLHDRFWDWHVTRTRYARLMNQRDAMASEWSPIVELQWRTDEVVTQTRSPAVILAQMTQRLAVYGIKGEEPVDGIPSSGIEASIGKGHKRKNSGLKIDGLSDSDEDDVVVIRAQKRRSVQGTQ